MYHKPISTPMNSRQTNEMDQVIPISWRIIQKMMVTLSQELYSNFTCRPCTPGMIEDWIMRTCTEHYNPGGYCEIVCQCEDMWECPHVIKEEGFQEDFQKGLNRIAKVIMTNIDDLSHNRADTFPMNIREKLMEHAHDRYGEGCDSDEEEDDEEEEDDYEMTDEEMYSHAYSSMYGPGFVY